jgi:iron complex outermembrane receptor protein
MSWWIYRGLGGVIALLVAGALPETATAQIQLPGIVVTAPSPVQRSRPRQRTVPAPTQATAPAPAPQAEPTLPPPGTLVIDDESFAAVTVVTAPEIEAQTAPNIADALALRPGIASSTFAPGASRPIIRGLDSYRVRTQENGIGTHDVASLSEDHAVPIDPFAAERIEIVRGPATLRYGSSAIGGVVDVSNGRIPETMPENGFSAVLKGGLNSVDRGHDGGFKVTAGAGNFVLYADAFRRQAEDYRTPRGRQINSFVESEGYSLGGSYVWADGFVGASYSRFASLYGSPGEGAAEERPRIDLKQEKVQSRGEWRVRDYGIEAIRYWLGTTRYGHNEVVFEEDDGHDIIGTRFTNRENEARVEVQHQPVGTMLGELRGAAGVQWGNKRVRGFGVDEPVDGLIDPAARSESVAAFLFEELQVTRALRLQAAARIENTRSRGTGVDLADPIDPLAPFDARRSFAPKSASVGLLYQLPLGVVARLTGQYTERAPDVAELFSKGVHEATGTFEIGNPNLGIEKAETIEFGLKRAHGAFRFDATAFHTRFDNFIFKRFTGVGCGDTLDTCGVEDELDQLVFDQRDATFRGVELSAQWDAFAFGRGVIGFEGQYDFVHATFAGGGYVPRIPPHRLGAGIYYRDTNWFARLFALHAFDQDKVAIDDARDTPTDGYTLLNADLSYTFGLDRQDGRISTSMTIGLKGENLLDQDVRNHVSFKKDEVLQPGRTIRLYGVVRYN